MVVVCGATRAAHQRSRVATVESGPFVYLLARDHAPALARLATENAIPAQAGQLLDRAQVRDARRSLVMLPLVHGLLGDRIGERHSEATLRQAGLGASSAHTFS